MAPSRPVTLTTVARTPPRGGAGQGGFALVATLSILVFLAILTLGFLSLSTISVRSARHADAEATAKANARLALLLALGQLQKAAGPDQRVTARADLLNETAPQRWLTGVWDAWEIRADAPPTPDDYTATAKSERFRTWLVSDQNLDGATETVFAEGNLERPVTLWGPGSLGATAPETSRVEAGRIRTEDGKGAVAWAVLDEGIKARIDMPFQRKTDTIAGRVGQLATGSRPGAMFLPGLDALDQEKFESGSPEFATIRKGITTQNFALAADTLAEGADEFLPPLLHDTTVHSVGLLTNTAQGGLRDDLSLLTNSRRLPEDFLGQGIYASRLGLRPDDVPSDPKWDAFQELAQLPARDVSLVRGAPVVTAMAPSRWAAAEPGRRGSPPTLNKESPPGLVLMPTVAKVQMIFSLIGRDIYQYPAFPPGPAPRRVPESAGNLHAPQDDHFRGTKYDYDLHLLYTPTVTLHNPYNVALDLSDVRIEFVHVPFAMQVFRNGVPQSRGLVPLETMYGDYSPGQRKIFGLNLKSARNGRPASDRLTLEPGEVKLFSPYLNPKRTYAQDLRDRTFWDIYVGTGLTSNIDAIPGWRGDGIGFDCDWLAGDLRVDGEASNGRWESCLGLAGDDEIHVEFAPLSTSHSENKFLVQMSASTSGRPGRTSVVNAIEIDYGKLKGLQETILGSEKVLRFPATGTVRGSELVDHSSRPISDIINVKPFAMLSLQAKTTYGGIDPGNFDGRLATKPWCFAHGSITSSSQNLLSEHPAHHSHEIDLQVLELDTGTSEIVPVDPEGRGVFVTGHTTFSGISTGALYPVPLGPIRTLAAFNTANPGGASGYLPRFAQPIGNSWAHPLLPPDRIIHPGPNGNLVDHSFLLNLALYDGYFFSGLGDRLGDFSSRERLSEVAAAFAAGEPLDDPRLEFYTPDQRVPADFVDHTEDTDAYSSIAGWQLMKGAFNINSTSVEAWKAMLASVHAPDAQLNAINFSSGRASLESISETSPGEIRISRFPLPLSESAAQGGPTQESYWLGAREFSEGEIETLAEEIVAQVRERGPFLSLAEFVNRQLGSGDHATMGALQQAIEQADLNTDLAETASAGYEITTAHVADYGYENPAAGVGPSYQGAPGYLTQADLLSVLGNAATARSDTFTIRGYGEARDPRGKLIGTAVCEAVVQRLPEWIDPSDAVETRPADLASPLNTHFGRRFEMLSFRWLNREEI